jgi:hypothetical protein
MTFSNGPKENCINPGTACALLEIILMFWNYDVLQLQSGLMATHANA